MKTKTPKARVMWANYYPEIVCCSTSRKSCRVLADTRFTNQVVRVAVIPLDDVDAIVERAQSATFGTRPSTHYEGITRKILTAAGIPCAKPTKQRRAKQ